MPRDQIAQTNGRFPRAPLESDDVAEQLVTMVNEHAEALDALDGAGGGTSNVYTATSYSWVDDWFLGQQLAVGNGWNGSAIGALPYSLTLVGANTAITPITGHGRLGVVSLDTGTTNTGQAKVATQAALSNVGGDVAETSFEFVGGVTALSTVAEEYKLTIGLVGNAPGYGVYFVYDRGNVEGANPTNLNCWSVVSMEAGVATRTLLPANTLGALSWPSTNVVRLKVVRDYVEDEARFYINGTLVHTETNNLPTHSLAGTVDILKSAGTTARSVAIDYTALSATLSTARTP